MTSDAKANRLKVYRTPIGFHDAYVAAASQAAALRAWGADANLFARGVAEVVTDEKLMAAPLASPGAVIKVARGPAAEHLAALPDRKPVTTAKRGTASLPAVKPKPRPSRAKLDAAEAALTKLIETQRAARQQLERREATLRRERKTLEAAQTVAREKLVTARDQAAADHDVALERWRE